MKLSILIPVGQLTEQETYRQRALNWVLARCRLLLPEAEIAFGTSKQAPFNRAEARNNAFRQSTGDVLLVMDADVIFHAPLIHKAAQLVSQTRTWVLPYGNRHYYNLAQWRTDEILDGDPGMTIPEPVPDEWEFQLESWAGLLVMPREAFTEAGMYDERFDKGWGWEDSSFAFALDTLWAPHTRLNGFLAHLWHAVTPGTTLDSPHAQASLRQWVRYRSANGRPDQMRSLINRR